MKNEIDNNQTLVSELSERIFNGIIKENPTFVLLLGMCPTLAVTTSAKNGLGMGLTTLVVLALSNLFISLLRKLIPDKVRIPAFIVIIASFVTMVELLLKAYIPSLYDSLGLYIPLIVVNCIILGRAEAYAYSHKALPSLFDGIGMGMGFTFALTIIGAFRELIGAGTIFSFRVMPSGYVPVSIFIMAPGAFFVLAMLTAIQNKIKEIGEKKGKDMSKIQSGCGGNCLECSKDCKTSNEPKDIPLATSTESNVMAPPEEFKPSTKLEDKKPDEKTEDKKSEAKENKKANKAEAEKSSGNEKEEVKAEEAVVEETKAEEAKPAKKKAEKALEEKPIAKKSSVKKPVEKKADEPESTPKEEEKTDSDADGDLELFDLNDYKNAIKKTSSSSKKPTRKKGSLEKAQALLVKAEETLREENND